MEIAEVDLVTVVNFAERVVSLAAYRLKLHKYLQDKMNSVAPNLAALIGEMVSEMVFSVFVFGFSSLFFVRSVLVSFRMLVHSLRSPNIRQARCKFWVLRKLSFALSRPRVSLRWSFFVSFLRSMSDVIQATRPSMD